MSLTIKTYPELQILEVPDLEDNTTISDVRAFLKEAMGEEKNIIKMIYRGALLQDGQTVEELKLKENDLIVVVLKTDRTKKKKKVARERQAEASQENEADGNEAENSNESNQESSQNRSGTHTVQAAALLQQLLGNPSLLNSVLTELARTEPELAARIRENPDIMRENPQEYLPPVFHVLISQMNPPRNRQRSLLRTRERQRQQQQLAQREQLSSEDQSHIQQLCELGFPENQALDAYFASDKNVEMAANLLFQMAGRS